MLFTGESRPPLARLEPKWDQMRTGPDRLGSVYQLRATDTRTLLVLDSLTRKKNILAYCAVAHAYNTSTQEVEPGRQPEARLGYIGSAAPQSPTPRKRQTKKTPQY